MWGWQQQTAEGKLRPALTLEKSKASNDGSSSNRDSSGSGVSSSCASFGSRQQEWGDHHATGTYSMTPMQHTGIGSVPTDRTLIRRPNTWRKEWETTA